GGRARPRVVPVRGHRALCHRRRSHRDGAAGARARRRRTLLPAAPAPGPSLRNLMEAKIVFTGPPNAGKTTAIGALRDVPPIVTDVSNHDAGLAKMRTTVGMDYGLVSLGDGEQVRLFGTPGQSRFDFMWRILVRNAIGIAILIDNSQPEALAQL